jgi:hypothetical protein
MVGYQQKKKKKYNAKERERDEWMGEMRAKGKTWDKYKIQKKNSKYLKIPKKGKFCIENNIFNTLFFINK